MQRLFYRVPEVAEMLGISRASAYVLVKRGEIQSVEIAGTIRVPTDAIDQFAKRLTSGSDLTPAA